ncbi:MAG TPA: glycosyltransferase family 2 protein, partial [Phycisphaerae bacterium]|nr:glycosyltransferase family 2 protein [Phycisphaerae bacterium]
MNGSAPKVSIGMPVYNGAATLAEALDALLAQTFTDFEVVINDNASTDATETICRQYAARDSRIRYERNATNLGAAGNFNRVFERARGVYFKWFACDDLLAPEYLAACVAALDDGGPDVVLAFPDRAILSPDGVRLAGDPYLVSGAPDDELAYDDISFPRLMRVCGSRCPIFVFGLMRRAAVAATRGMGNYIAADLVFVAELRLIGRFRRVPQTLFFQRLHPPTPEVLARTRRKGDAAWFDPRKRVRSPEWKLFVEMVRAVSRSRQPGLDKARCYVALGGHIATRTHRWSVLAIRRLRAGMWRTWTRISTATVAAERVTALPLRLWVLAAGLRRADAMRIRWAFSRPWWGSNPRLITFGAGRLGRRGDVHAARVLVAWMLGPSHERRRAAAEVIAGESARCVAQVTQALQERGGSPEAFLAALDRYAS